MVRKSQCCLRSSFAWPWVWSVVCGECTQNHVALVVLKRQWLQLFCVCVCVLFNVTVNHWDNIVFDSFWHHSSEKWQKNIKNVRIPHQDRAIAHSKFLSDLAIRGTVFGNSKIIHRLWPPSSSDMNLCNYYLCGPPKDTADVNNSHSLLEMRENIQTETVEYINTSSVMWWEIFLARLLHKTKLYCRRKLTLNSW